MKIVVQHNSGQFSDTRPEHLQDAEALFAHAVDVGAWAVTGTESGDSPTNHDARDAVRSVGEQANFFVHAHKYGEWVALNRRFLHHFDQGFMGPFAPGTVGLSPSRGGHGPRGIAWAQGEAKNGDSGVLTFGSTHWLTQRSIDATGVSNDRMRKGAQRFGDKFGAGRGLVFLNGDANIRDDTEDLFKGGDFYTIADELNEHPKTHGRDTAHGEDIDFLASWRPDGRVRAESYRVLDDNDLKLYFDHFMLLGTYHTAPLDH